MSPHGRVAGVLGIQLGSTDPVGTHHCRPGNVASNLKNNYDTQGQLVQGDFVF